MNENLCRKTIGIVKYQSVAILIRGAGLLYFMVRGRLLLEKIKMEINRYLTIAEGSENQNLRQEELILKCVERKITNSVIIHR